VKTFGVAYFTALVIAASPVWAGSAGDTLSEIASAQGAIGTLQNQQRDLATANDADMKVYNSYNDSNKELDQRMKAISEAFKADASARIKNANSIVENWDNECAIDRVGPLPDAQYERCARLKPEVQRTAQSIRDQVKRDSDEIDRTKIAPLVDTRRRQERAMSEISERTKERLDVIEKMNGEIEELRTKLQNLRRQLAANCAAHETEEDVQVCTTVGWNAANSTLPPLEYIRPPLSAGPN